MKIGLAPDRIIYFDVRFDYLDVFKMEVYKTEGFVYILHEKDPLYSVEFPFDVFAAVDRNTGLLAFTVTQI